MGLNGDFDSRCLANESRSPGDSGTLVHGVPGLWYSTGILTLAAVLQCFGQWCTESQDSGTLVHGVPGLWYSGARTLVHPQNDP